MDNRLNITNDKELKQELKDLLAPHFGHLKLYHKWAKEHNSENLNKSYVFIEKVHNKLNEQKYKSITKQLPKPLIQYGTAKEALSDLKELSIDVGIKRIFKDGLNGRSRSFFKKTYKENKEKYVTLLKQGYKLRLFFISSSRPQSQEEYEDYLDNVINFNNSTNYLINKIEEEIDYLVTDNGGYLFPLDNTLLKFVPSSWCICNNPDSFESYLGTYNSIWLLVDPHEVDMDRRMVGINIPKDYHNNQSLSFQNSSNKPINEDFPIEPGCFYKIARTRLKNGLIDKLSNESIDKLKKIQNIKNDNVESEYQKLLERKKKQEKFKEQWDKFF